MTANQIAYWKNVETERSNRAREQETQRSNMEQERLIPSQILKNETSNWMTVLMNYLLGGSTADAANVVAGKVKEVDEAISNAVSPAGKAMSDINARNEAVGGAGLLGDSVREAAKTGKTRTIWETIKNLFTETFLGK